MKKRSLANILAASAAAFMMIFSLSVSASAWNENPFDAPVTAETTTAEEENPDDIVPEDEDVEEEEPEETVPPEPEEEEPEQTTPAPVETTAPADTAPEPEVIQTAAELPQPSYTAVESYTMYAPQVINVRSGPSTDYDKLGALYANSSVTVIGTSGDWVAVSYNGQTGFVLGSLLTATEPQTSTSAAEVETQPQETEPVTSEEVTEMTEAPVTEPVVEITTTTSKPPETTPASQTTKNEASSVNGTATAFPPVLLALLCAVGVFLVIAVIPITVHKLHHRKLYRY